MQEPLDWDEWKERMDAAKDMFFSGEMSEDQLRRLFARQHFNATEIEREIEELRRLKAEKQ